MEKEARRVKIAPTDSSAWEPQDQEERELEELFRNGTIARAIAKFEARGSYVKLKLAKKSPKIPVTLRLDQITLTLLKDKARNEGTRYQSIISSILFQYVTGRLVERKGK